MQLAGRLFAEHGYDASMNDLAERAGVTKPVIYYYFGSKAGVVDACVEVAMQGLADTIMAATGPVMEPRARLHAGAVAWFEFISRVDDPWASVIDPRRHRGEPDYERNASRTRQAQAALVEWILHDTVAASGARIDPLELNLHAHTLIGLFETYALWWSDHPDIDARTLADWLIENVWSGLGAQLRVAASA